jgi:hypothetical protein
MLATMAKLGAYTVGQILHVALQADAVRRARNNGTASYRDFFRLNGVRLSARTFLCSMIFIFWWNNPTSLVDVLGYIGWNIPDKIAHLISLPLTVPTSGIFGLASDSILSFIPGLKNAVPQLDE